MTLVEFLTARLDEDEAAARDASPSPWTDRGGYVNDHMGSLFETDVYSASAGHEPDARHIARHDPARVLAECEAKRAIIAWHEQNRSDERDCCEERHGPPRPIPYRDQVTIYDRPGDPMSPSSTAVARVDYYGCVTMMMLAAVYADHPDYREEWKP